jgi:endonuclease/exonuclease/phosphatase family metal-dependent hydrolase
MRIATFNLLHGLSLRTGVATEADLREAVADLDADVVGLQEVDHGQDRSAGIDQTAVIADELAAAYWRLVPAVLGAPGPARTWTVATDEEPMPGVASYGVGLVSRHPVRAWHVLRFPAAPGRFPLQVPGDRPRLARIPDEPRVAVAAVVDAPFGPITVITAHLSFVPGFNIGQLRRLARWAIDLPGPHLLIGDFNLPGLVPGLVTGWTQLARVPTYPAARPRVQLDHVLGRGVGLEAVRAVSARDRGISDHRALVVDLELAVVKGSSAPDRTLSTPGEGIMTR